MREKRIAETTPFCAFLIMNLPELPKDPTPISRGLTDVAPLTHLGPKPAHERTAGEDPIAGVQWEKIEAMSEFNALLADKAKFVIPGTLFFVIYYFALPVLVGFAPKFMDRHIWGGMNAAYLFGLSQFFMAWAVAGLYIRAAARWDKQSDAVLRKARHK